MRHHNLSRLTRVPPSIQALPILPHFFNLMTLTRYSLKGPLIDSHYVTENYEIISVFPLLTLLLSSLTKGLTAADCHRGYFLYKWWLEHSQYKETPLWPEEPSVSHKMILGALFLVIFSETILAAVPSFGACPENRGHINISKLNNNAFYSIHENIS